MEDKNLTPGNIPEDMPALNLDDLEGQPREPETLEPLFPQLPSDTAGDAPADEIPTSEEPASANLPGEEAVDSALPEAVEEAPAAVSELPPEELVVADPAASEPAEETGTMELPSVAAAAVEGELPQEIPAEAPDPVCDELPPRDFSEFDIPMDTPSPEVPQAPEYADPVQTTENTVIFDLNLPESTANANGMDQPYQEPPLEPAAEAKEEFIPTPPADSKPKDAVKAAPAVRKGRPKPKKGDGLWGIPHLLATLLWLGIIVAIGVSLGRMLWLCAADVLAFGRESREVIITIDTDDTIEDIAQKLHEKGLIKYPGLFKLYADLAVDDGEIAPGTYTLNTILDYHALVGSMSSSSSHRAVVEDVLIPEGYSCRQIFELLEQNGICTVAELEEYAANGEFQEFWFLEGVERGNKYCLEGFLFPDTYDFYANSTPREALGKMLLGFNSRIDQEEITAQLVTLNERLSAKMKANGCSEEFIAENQFDLYDLLTVASLIEEETAGASESPNIASVIYNRLTQNEVYERYLGIDAAIIYATGDAENIDTGINSPYNTYINAGLTPTPISNPGLSSINAALDFADTNYYYYVLNPETQLHQFSKTYEEHQEWIEKFRGE